MLFKPKVWEVEAEGGGDYLTKNDAKSLQSYLPIGQKVDVLVRYVTLKKEGTQIWWVLTTPGKSLLQKASIFTRHSRVGVTNSGCQLFVVNKELQNCCACSEFYPQLKLKTTPKWKCFNVF